MDRRQLLALSGTLALSALLYGCGSGSSGNHNNSSTTLALPDQDGFRARNIVGTVVLPTTSAVSLNTLTAVNVLSQTPVTSAGQFTLSANVEAAQLIYVQDAQQRAVLLGISYSETSSVTIDAGSTALALLFAHPFFAAGDAASGAQSLQILAQVQQVADLASYISALVASRGYLDTTDAGLSDKLSTAFQAATSAVLNGTVTRGRTSRARTRDVTPTSAQSYIVVNADNYPDANHAEVEVANFGVRWLEVWSAPVDASGDVLSSPVSLGLIAAATTDLLGVLTGGILEEASAKYTVAVPATAAATQLQIWGPGLADSGNFSTSDFVTYDSLATVATVLCCFGKSILHFLVGLDLKFEKNVEKVQHLLETVFTGLDVLEIAGNLEAGDYFKTTFNIVSLILTDDKRRNALIQYVLSIGLEGVTQDFLQKALLRASVFFKLWSAFSDGFSLGAATASLVTSREEEIFTVTTSEDQPTGTVFRVTLSWNQPNDMDLHVFAPDGEESWYGNKQISDGSLDVDDTDGFGPENFTLTQASPGLYQVAVNYYSDHQDSNFRPTSVHINVQTADGTMSFGPYTLTVPDFDSEGDINDSTSWWRPCDIQVTNSGSVQVQSPNRSTTLRSRATRAQKLKRR